MTTIAVFIGRFQPFHSGHLAMLKQTLKIGEKTVVVLGSAHQARSPKNPFSWEERAAMIRLSLTEEEANSVSFLPVRDYYDNAKWVAAVQAGVYSAAKETPATAKVKLVGHLKDATSYYLDHFQDWEQVMLDRQSSVDATPLRRILFGSPARVAMEALSGHVPEAVIDYLRAWTELPYYSTIKNEWLKIKEYRDKWEGSPFPPTFLTADAVVKCGNKVLLVKRKGDIGDGLWAVPGGFLDPNETLLQASLRELTEETSISRLHVYWENDLKATKVFDHPQRSLRGRTVTQAFFFDLGHTTPPYVQAADGVSVAEWIDIERLPEMEDLFFEDHFHMLNHFFKFI